MAKLWRHQTDGTYYIRVYFGAMVTRQLHPNGLVWLKQHGVRPGVELPERAVSVLDDNGWLFTKDQIPMWGEVDWAPEWHQVGRPPSGGLHSYAPHVPPESIADDRKEAKRLVRESEREAKTSSKAVARSEHAFWQSSLRANARIAEMNRLAEANRAGKIQPMANAAKPLARTPPSPNNRKARKRKAAEMHLSSATATSLPVSPPVASPVREHREASEWAWPDPPIDPPYETVLPAQVDADWKAHLFDQAAASAKDEVVKPNEQSVSANSPSTINVLPIVGTMPPKADSPEKFSLTMWLLMVLVCFVVVILLSLMGGETFGN